MCSVDTSLSTRVADRLSAALAGTGVTVTPTGDANADVRLAIDRTSWRFAVVSRARAPYPNELVNLPDLPRRAGRLLVCNYMPERVGARLEEAGWSWADDAGNHSVTGPGLRLRQRLRGEAPARPTRRLLPQGEAGLRVVRHLVEHDGDVRPSVLAERLGLPRPRVAQILARLQDAGLAQPRTRGVWHAERDSLVDAFLADYRGPGGSATYWYTLDEPLAAAQALATAAPEVVVSGDVASDLLAPWRRPTHLIVYHLGRLTPPGMVEAAGRADANIEVRSPADLTVFPTEPLQAAGLALADPLQVLWDEQALGGDDRDEAVGRYRQWLLSRPAGP